MFATMAEAHAEWHLNSGVPMGQAGCPMDACHPMDEEAYESQDVTLVKCGLCKQHRTVEHVRAHYADHYEQAKYSVEA